MKNEMKQFIGIFPNAINDDTCSRFVKWFDEIKNWGLTLSSFQDSNKSEMLRKDEVVGIPLGLSMSCFPLFETRPFWQNIQDCLDIYQQEYSTPDNLTSYDFKIHRVQPTGGYHAWHHEHMYTQPHRVLAWHLTIESPKSGGETEFLYQSMRVEPKVGQLLIWPAGFTHKHRGNPPLEGQKTYITGWFNLTQL